MNSIVHGTEGERHETVRFINGTSCCRVWANARWCAVCADWVHPTGITSLVLSAVCCPKCHTRWDDVEAALVALRVAKAAPSGDLDPYADPDGNPVPGFNVRGD